MKTRERKRLAGAMVNWQEYTVERERIADQNRKLAAKKTQHLREEIMKSGTHDTREKKNT